MKKINILHFTSDRSFGGTAKMAQLMLEYANKDKFNIFAVSYEGGPRIQSLIDNKIPYFVSQDNNSLVQWIHGQHIDICHLYRSGLPEPRAIAILKAAGVPTIVEQNCFGEYDSSPDEKQIDIHVVNSNTSHIIYRNRAKEKYRQHKMRMVYCPIENDKFKNVNINYDQPTFGRFSRNDAKKWHMVNIKCLPYVKEAVPNAKFYVIGMPDEYREAAKELGVYDMIIEMEAPTDKDLLNFLSKISVFTHASLVGESFGNAIAESMSCGLPIITHKGGDSAQAEIVTHGVSGFVLENFNDEKAYAEKLIELLKNPDLKRQMGLNARKICEQYFDVKLVVNQLEEVYEEQYELKVYNFQKNEQSTIMNLSNITTNTKHGTMIINQNDTGVGMNLQIYGEVHELEISFLKQFCLPGGTVFDCGANIGNHTLAFAKSVGPTGEVFSFEPQEHCFQLLCANASINNIFNIHAFKCALGNENKSVTIPYVKSDNKFNFGGLSLKESHIYKQFTTVDQKKLDDFCYISECNLLKIDVEGCEYEVLLGGKNFINKLKPVIYCENNRIEQYQNLVDFFKDNGYIAYSHLPPSFNENNFKNNKSNHLHGSYREPNLIAIPNEKQHIMTNKDFVEPLSFFINK